MAKKDESMSTCSVDSPLVEITMEMVNYPLSDADKAKNGANGKKKSPIIVLGTPNPMRSKPRKKTIGRRKS